EKSERRMVVVSPEPVRGTARKVALPGGSRLDLRSTRIDPSSDRRRILAMPIPLSHPALELRTYGGEVRRHAHPHHQAVLPVEGQLAMRVGGSSGAVAAGAGVFVAASTDHTFSAAAGANRFVVIHLPAPRP